MTTACPRCGKRRYASLWWDVLNMLNAGTTTLMFKHVVPMSEYWTSTIRWWFWGLVVFGGLSALRFIVLSLAWLYAVDDNT